MTVDVGPVHDEGSESPALEVHGLRVVLGEQPALRGVDLTVARGARLGPRRTEWSREEHPVTSYCRADSTDQRRRTDRRSIAES